MTASLTPLGKHGKEVPQTILASDYTSPLLAIYGNNTFQKGASLSKLDLLLQGSDEQIHSDFSNLQENDKSRL